MQLNTASNLDILFALDINKTNPKTKVDMWISLRMQLWNVGGGQRCIHHLHELGLQMQIFNAHQCVNVLLYDH